MRNPSEAVGSIDTWPRGLPQTAQRSPGDEVATTVRPSLEIRREKLLQMIGRVWVGTERTRIGATKAKAKLLFKNSC